MNKWLRILLILGLLFFLVQSPVEAAGVVTQAIDFLGRLVGAISTFFSQLAANF